MKGSERQSSPVLLVGMTATWLVQHRSHLDGYQGNTDAAPASDGMVHLDSSRRCSHHPHRQSTPPTLACHAKVATYHRYAPAGRTAPQPS